MSERTIWPEGKAFAFTVFDDTDRATVDNVGPVYAFLADLGMRTTKSVWPLEPERDPVIGGATCEDARYRDWTLELQARGFEIGSHGASPATSPRPVVARALDRFREVYGHDPRTFANHSGCEESVYWGCERVSGVQRLAYDAMTRFGRHGVFRGHREGDELFWGDLCRDRVGYVRNFTYDAIDTLAACPVMPYHDPDRPYVRAWFASSEGADVDAFVRQISVENQERLEASAGACIMYTHFSSGFLVDGALDHRFRELMERLASRNGWFVPAGVLLEHLEAQRGLTIVTRGQRAALERRWLRSKVRVGYS